MEHILKVGAARRNISPLSSMFPIDNFYGYGGLTGGYECVREGEDLNVRAIVVDNGERRFLFAAFELGCVPAPERILKIMKDRFGFAPKDVMITATHDHSAPKLSQKPETDETMKRYLGHVLAQTEAAVEAAIAGMKPARFGYGETKSYINVNRDKLFDDGYWMQGCNFEGCSDKTLAVLKFEDLSGNLIAAVLNYAMHSMMCFGSRDYDGRVKITCDTPGIACNFVERYYGGDAVVLWQSGAAGNQNPVRPYAVRYDCNGVSYSCAGEQPDGSAYLNSTCLAEQHAMDAIRVLKATAADRTEVQIRTAAGTVSLPGQRAPENADYFMNRLMADNLLVWQGLIRPGEKWEKKLMDMIPTDETVTMNTQMLLFGDVAFYGMAGELYNEIGLLCKANFPGRHLVITTHICAPTVFYVLDDASKDKKVFQSFGPVRPGENNALVLNGMRELYNSALADES